MLTDFRKSIAIALAVSANAAMGGTALVGDWSGPYVGISGGGGWAGQGQHTSILLPSGGGGSTTVTTTVTTTTTTTPPPTGGHYHLSGGLVGGAVRYNWQISNFVFGLEGDGSWADISGSGNMRRLFGSSCLRRRNRCIWHRARPYRF